MIDSTSSAYLVMFYLSLIYISNYPRKIKISNKKQLIEMSFSIDRKLYNLLIKIIIIQIIYNLFND